MINITKKLLYHPQLSKWGYKLLFTSIYTLLILYYLWSIPAIYFLNIPWEWLRLLLSWSFALGVPAILIIFRENKKSLWVVAGISLFFGVWFSMIPASNNREWNPNVAKLPSVQFNGDKVTIKNVRNFTYRSSEDFTSNYYTQTYDLNKLNQVYYILSYWDDNKNIAHTMLSFAFEDGKHLCVSVETRREKNEPQTGLRGIYNQYELIYILADESDILLLRTNYRDEKVYLYPLKPKNKENPKKLFLEILKQVDYLNKHPIFYNTLKHNCFTTLFGDAKRAIGEPGGIDYRLILNGLSDKMGYERGWFYTDGLSFDDFKKKHNINQYIQNDKNPKKDFSKKIRPYEIKK